MRVIGTAGHVDHGKSTLVEALTGIHPDRLKEEREREMTIDLGFGWMILPNGEEVGIVDVPGHRDFIENMLAGVGGIDAALFVVAADEGVMPQTREHLAILDTLQIQGGVVALTKTDMVDDIDWLALVEDDLHQVMYGTVLENARIVRVSARKGEGIGELIQAISDCLANRPPRPDLGRPRLPVDRVFSIAGFGTVVTGTLSDGQLRVGDEIELLPRGLRGRVRGLQTHKRKEEVAVPGSRTAVNISGIPQEQVQRGDVLAHIGDYHPTRRMDVRFRLHSDASKPLSHNREVKLFIGAAEVLARVRLLGSEKIDPGEEGWLQLELHEPIVAMRADRFILRRPSPGETLGGGSIVDPFPKGRHKRFSQGLLDRLKSLDKGTPAEVLAQALLSSGAVTMREAFTQTGLEAIEAVRAIEELSQSGGLVILEEVAEDLSINSDVLVAGRDYWETLTRRALQEVDNYHTANPLRRGLPREELKSKLKISPRLFNALIRKLVAAKQLEERGLLVSRWGYNVFFTPQQEHSIQELLRRFAASPYAPPSIKDTRAEVGEDVYSALVDQDVLVPVSDEVVFRREDYEHMIKEVLNMLDQQGTITAAQVRDHFDTSRRYVLALLEHLDSIGVTVREGDVRRLRQTR